MKLSLYAHEDLTQISIKGDHADLTGMCGPLFMLLKFMHHFIGNIAMQNMITRS